MIGKVTIESRFALRVDDEHCLVVLSGEEHTRWLAGELETVDQDQIRERCGHHHRDMNSKSAERCWRRFMEQHLGTVDPGMYH